MPRRVLAGQGLVRFPPVPALGQHGPMQLAVATDIHGHGLPVAFVAQDTKTGAVPGRRRAEEGLQRVQHGTDRKVNTEVQLDAQDLTMRRHV